jgi:hypothetical protein
MKKNIIITILSITTILSFVWGVNKNQGKIAQELMVIESFEALANCNKIRVAQEVILKHQVAQLDSAQFEIRWLAQNLMQCDLIPFEVLQDYQR